MTKRVPASWARATLGDITVQKVDQRAPVSESSYIDISSIDRDKKEIGELRLVHADSAPTRARQWVKRGDVLVSMTRPNLNAVAMVPEQLNGAVASTGFDVLRALSVLPSWIFNRVRSREFIADVCQNLQGVVYPAVRPRDIRAHVLPIPPLPEQHRIVEAIESYLTRLDDAVASLERVQRNLERYRASVLKAAVEGRLVPTEAELARQEGRDYEPASELLRRITATRQARWESAELQRLRAQEREPAGHSWRSRYREPASPATSETVALPDGWCWASLDQLTYFTVDYRGKTPPIAESGVRTISAANVKAGGLVFDRPRHVSQDTYREWAVRGLPRPGDLLVTTEAPVGEAALYPDQGTYLLTRRVIALQTVGVDNRYIAYCFSGDVVRKHIAANNRGTTVPRILKPALLSTTVPLPPAAEQRRIVESVESLLSRVDGQRAATSFASRHCDRLRQSILKWAFEGKLVEQDPDDEPAAVLLERIKAEREAAPKPGPKRKKT